MNNMHLSKDRMTHFILCKLQCLEILLYCYHTVYVEITEGHSSFTPVFRWGLNNDASYNKSGGVQTLF